MAGDQSIKAIAARLQRTRIALGLTPSEFADRAKLARNTASQLEHAKGRPGLDTAITLVDAYGLTLDWIYFGDMRQLPYDLATRIRELERESQSPIRVVTGNRSR